MNEKKVSIKSKIGITFIVLSFITPLFALIIPFIGLSESFVTIIVTLFMFGIPEIFLILGGVLAGKEGILLVKNKIKKILGIPERRYPASKTQYNLALILLIFWAISLILPYYFPALNELIYSSYTKWYYFAISDIVFIISIAYIGGDQLITKISKVFKWEEWNLPQKKEE